MNQERLMSILVSPWISEKSTTIADNFNQFTFRVQKNARKNEIKQAVEKVFNVEVLSVNTLNITGKSKSSRRGISGKRPDWKKAYVRLKPGYDINYVSMS